eukprot:jgi/Botrbrau1/615/Bobra.0161s0011.1
MEVTRQQPLLDPQNRGYDASSSAPTAPPLPTSTLAGPVVSFQDHVPGSAGFQGYDGQQRDYSPATGYPAYPPPVVDYPAGPGYGGPGYARAPVMQINTRTIIMTPITEGAVTVTCPYCNYRGQTLVTKESGFCTWLSSFTLCFLGCCILSPLPFCCGTTKDTVHRCANCGSVLGRRRP